ncbi:MAG: hypothetical protein ACI9VM_000414 [Candidatus Azotimanducaceae bacterium]|jgi:hypothetical protein
MIDQPAILSLLFSKGFELVFYLTLLFFALYTLFLAYHWFAYGTHKTISLLALAVYLMGSAPLFIVMAANL